MRKFIFGAILLSLILAGYYLLSVKNAPTSGNNSNNTATSGTNTDKISAIPANNRLDLSDRGLKSVPKYVFEMKNLEGLDLSGNQLTGALPGEIRFLQNLKILDASNNQMTGVPAEIGQLKYLEVLNLANNQLTGLPYELGNLKNLKTFNLSGNNYSEYDLGIIRPNLPANVNIIK